MSTPFLGHLYSADSGTFEGSCLGQDLTTTQIELTDRGCDVTVVFGNAVDPRAFQVSAATHVVTGATLALDQCVSGDKRRSCERVEFNINWGNTQHSALSQLELDLQFPFKNAVISYLTLCTVSDFIKWYNSESEEVDQPVLAANGGVLSQLDSFLGEVREFINVVDGTVKEFIGEAEREQLTDIMMSVKNKRSSVKDFIMESVKELGHSSWLESIDWVVECLAKTNNEFEVLRKSFNELKNELKGKEKLVKFFRDLGVQYWSGKQDLKKEIESQTNKHKQYYILLFGKDLHQASPQENNIEYMIKKFVSLAEDEEHGAHFIAVDLDVVELLLLPMKLPHTPTIYYYENGQCVSHDVVKDMENPNKTGTVKCNVNPTKSNPPRNKCLLKIPCPASFCSSCSDAAQEWVCSECEEKVEYGFQDSILHCGCGSSAITNFGFRCSDFKHGRQFTEYQSAEWKEVQKQLKPMKEYNLLMLGQSGVGKSTWINAIINYMHYNSLENAKQGEQITTIPTKFTLTDDNWKTIDIVHGADDNENMATGASGTQDCKTYYLYYDNKVINVIDTPGIGDTRGVKQDATNVRKILDHIRHISHLNGICILLKPNEARIGVLFEFCVKELLTHLHKSASCNIVFCFTHCRSTFYKPGNTLEILEKLLRDTKVQIALSNQRVYCLDNEAYRFLCTLNYPNLTHSDSDYKSYSESWDKSVVETRRMLDYLFTLQPHLVKDTTSLNNARSIILSLAKPLADTTQNIERNIALIRDHRRMIENWNQSEEKLVKKLATTRVVLEPIGLGYPRTVCTNKTCVQQIKLPSSDFTQTKYIAHCHPHCYLVGVVPETHPNRDILMCAAMAGQKFCQGCRCSWEKHMHIMYDQVSTEIKVLNHSVKLAIESNADLIEMKQIALESAENEIKEYEFEKKKILEICAKFGYFLKKNAFTPYNDSIKAYITFLINEEKSKSDRTLVDQEVLRELENTKLVYEEEVKILEMAMSSNEHSEPFTAQNIKQWQEELYALPHCGPQLHDIMDVALKAQETAAMFNTKSINTKSFSVRPNVKNNKQNEFVFNKHNKNMSEQPGVGAGAEWNTWRSKPNKGRGRGIAPNQRNKQDLRKGFI